MRFYDNYILPKMTHWVCSGNDITSQRNKINHSNIKQSPMIMVGTKAYCNSFIGDIPLLK